MKNGTGDTQNMSQSKVGFFNILFQWKKTPLEWGFGIHQRKMCSPFYNLFIT